MECPNCHENIHKSQLAEYEAIFSETHHLKELRTTNNPASADDLAYVHDELFPAIENDITSLGERISDLRRAIELLTEEKEDLTRLANNFKSLISPHRRLPPELLMEIFKYACKNDLEYSRDDSVSPYILACVCSGWRQVALSCPVIWSRIAFYSEDSEKYHHPSFTQALDTTLCRSGNSPLYITLSHPRYESAAQAFLKHVSIQSTRWGAITLVIDSDFADTAFPMLRRSYPLVDLLDVNIYPSSDVDSVPQTGFSQYPRLRTIVLHDSILITTDLPWAQITTLQIAPSFVQSADDLTSCFQVLRQCPALQTLVVVSEPPSDLQILAPTFTVTLQDLKCLETSFGLIMDHLCLPKLEVARLSTSRGQRYNDSGQLKEILASFLKLVSRSKCASRIHSLSIEKVPLTDDLLSLLSLTQNLVTLNIRAKMAYTTTPDEPQPECEAMETIISLVRKLEVKPGQETFLPLLQHITITLSRHVDKYKFPYLRELVRILQSRRHVESHLGLERLKTFKYWISARDLDHIPISYYTLKPQARDALQLLENDGMVISIRVRSKLVRPDIPCVMVDFGRCCA